MNVAIVGSRTFYEDAAIHRAIDALFSKYNGDVTIVSGGAQGADSIAEFGARSRGLPIIVHPAEWSKYGKSAGYKRNELIVRDADMLLAFYAPGPLSKGTTHSVTIARAKGIPVHIYHEGTWS